MNKAASAIWTGVCLFAMHSFIEFFIVSVVMLVLFLHLVSILLWIQKYVQHHCDTTCAIFDYLLFYNSRLFTSFLFSYILQTFIFPQKNVSNEQKNYVVKKIYFSAHDCSFIYRYTFSKFCC